MRAEESDVLPIGSVASDGSSEIRFYVSKFKGRLYGHIRKFVKTADYNGPTPSGVALTRETIQAVSRALAPLKLGDPVSERELVRVPRGAGLELVARLSVYKDKAGIDFRDWVSGGAYTGWSKKGVRLPYEYLPQIQQYLSRMEVFFRGPTSPS